MFGKMTARIVLMVLLALALFAGGVVVGKEERPEIEKVVGLVNSDTPFGLFSITPSDVEIEACIDESGAQVPCVLDGTILGGDPPADFEQFWRAWNIINEKYVPPKKSDPITNQEKVWGAISGLAGSLGDPYTFFLPPQEKSLFEQDVSGFFGGVGMQIGMKDDLLTVIAPLKGSPAERAGIQKGDKILVIDGATTTNMTIDKALYLIRGEIGKPVVLTLLHEDNDEPYVVTIIREEIKVPTIETKREGDVFVISLYGFPATGAELFRGALREFVQSGADKLVLDLRGNPGGYLEVAVDMASWFLPQGKVVVREEDKSGEGQIYRSKGYNVFGDDFRFVILVDGGSASASEILAAALKEHGIATLVGTKTFGKGSVQELVPITEDTSLKVTIAHWITPNGNSFSEEGIEPNVVVEITKEQVEREEDPQLKKAVELVRSL